MEDVLLHGDLDLWILSASHLPNMDLFSERLRRCGTSCGLNIPVTTSPTASSTTRSTSDTLTHTARITSDPYVSVVVAGATIARTIVIPNNQNPKWNQHFLIPLAHRTSHIYFYVKDSDFVGVDEIGSVSIPASCILSGKLIEDRYPICRESKDLDSDLHLKMQFFPIQMIPKMLGVERSYFRERTSGSVTLYQDAHVREEELREIPLGDGGVFRRENCWEDICHAIIDAKKLIYIVGWSIYHRVRLMREESGELSKLEGMPLGELLKQKAQEGVRVLLLVWDDRTSHHQIKKIGLMQTHDEETRWFFKHSSVICVLSPRYASSKLSLVKKQVVGILFTHHQKCLLVDTPATGTDRKLTAFLGGLDLCDGRYDTPDHRLFSDLDKVFSSDARNPTFPEETKGPRQPWHDLHCKIEGPAAYDVLKNFEQRWRKATKSWVLKHFSRAYSWKDIGLIKLEHNRSGVVCDDPNLSKEDDYENWHVQIFRSIDSGSVQGFPNDVHEAEKQNLFFRKNVVIDKSVHTAYVNAIRSAEHFIYIENQYFIGSCYGWPSCQSTEANNLIPMELVLKILSKIRAKEQFAVYIIIPMWPEGQPDSAVVQRILFWQNQTIKMMYKEIGEALKLVKDAHPQDYLNFYCLGNREEETSPSTVQPSDKSAVGLCQKYRRFMVYVHAKGMIVDDQYIILGSANINQRSMDGSRDTEIAMGAYQPHYTWGAKKQHPHGQVYGYRMSLWQEHLGLKLNDDMEHLGLKLNDDRFKEPESSDCVKLINSIANCNWNKYTADEYKPLQGHLLKYPLKVEVDGEVYPLPGHTTFPDVGGRVEGTYMMGLAELTT